MESLVDWVFVLVTGAIAYHGITCRAPDGERDTVRTLFGCIVLLFCLRVLLVDSWGWSEDAGPWPLPAGWPASGRQ